MATILKHKKDDTYGTLEYSMFGGSVHFYGNDGIISKNLGGRLNKILEDWDIVDMPEGYEIGEYGGLKKIK
ncbi:hypothetical protein [Paenibacillus sp. QZ-Y1]|uniref:hypothetical protein n=1 Tax=Paenibacillus sp. QZ-Y1 TaxID=3414511 RepID=UPI003F7A1AFC